MARTRRVVFGRWTVKQRGPGRPRVACDGTANDYQRHIRRKEEPCFESRKAWNKAIRRYNRTGIWDGTLPYRKERDEQRNYGDFGRGVHYPYPDRYPEEHYEP